MTQGLPCAGLNSAVPQPMEGGVKLTSFFSKQPKWLLLTECVGATGAIGVLDRMTSWEVSLFVFYGLPIFVTSWYFGRLPGLIMAGLAGLAWYFANLTSNPYETFNGYFWAAINRAVYFGFVAFGSLAMREQREQTLARLAAVIHSRELEQEIVRAGEREQIRIGQDLHDGVCQNLAAIDCAAECLREELEQAGLPQAAAAAQIQEFLKATLVDARNLARGIFPVQVETDGLISALNEMVTRAGITRRGEVTLDIDEAAVPDSPAAEMQLYRITQEALSNATRHAHAEHIRISLKRQHDHLHLTITDDGRGFPAANSVTFGIGIRAMQNRAHLLGGELEIRSNPQTGTTVLCKIPQSRPTGNRKEEHHQK